MSWFTEIEESVAWEKEAEGSMFFGEPIANMSRDELMAVIGYLAKDADATRKRHDSDMALMWNG
jgi:hypothetical protein